MRRYLLSLVLTLVLIASAVRPAAAGWGDFFDENGNPRPGVIDLGIQRVPADWMEIPEAVRDFARGVFGTGVDQYFEATYHVWALPNGETVMAPSATTLFFMAMNPVKSGLLNNEGAFTQSSGMLLQGLGLVAGGNIAGRDALNALLQVLGMHNDEIADAAIRGENAWTTLLTSKDLYDLFRILLGAMRQDKQALYLAMFLYGHCSQSPIGCPDDLVKRMTTPEKGQTSDRTTQICGAPSITRGRITAAARKTAPNYALVVGQDPEQRGVDLEFTLTISPTVYTYYTLHSWQEPRCVDAKGRSVKVKSPIEKNCVPPYKLEWETKYSCEQHTQTFCEQVRSVTAVASLKQSSRDWIQGELAQWYPGAHLYQPDWRWSGGRGSCDAGNTFTWTLRQNRVQVRDPGFYALSVSGVTGGTPVTQPRPFNLGAGEFDVYLKETTVIR